MKKKYALALRAALQAGKAILEVYKSEDFAVETKEDHSPLTRADRRAHRIIMDILQESDLPVLSEEGKHLTHEDRRSWERFWLVDPLDGTKEFIKRNGEFTVNIALVDQGRSVFGVVYAPVIKELYIGIPGRGAWRCRKEKNMDLPLDYLLQFADQLPLKTRERMQYRVVASRSHFNDETLAYIRQLDTRGKEIVRVSKGSSLKLCMVATGEADIYPRLGPTMEWDTAAAHAVVKAVGKNVYRIRDATELEYNKENLLNPHFVVK